jgi:hypothetical protein
VEAAIIIGAVLTLISVAVLCILRERPSAVDSFCLYVSYFFTGFYSPYRTLAFLNGLLDPQAFGRTPWLGDQSNTRPLPI